MGNLECDLVQLTADTFNNWRCVIDDLERLRQEVIDIIRVLKDSASLQVSAGVIDWELVVNAADPVELINTWWDTETLASNVSIH